MDQTMGKRISANRKRLGMTQDQLAERLGVTAQAVSKWENDQSCPDVSTIPRIAEIFGITTDELLGVREETVHVGEIVNNNEEGVETGSWEFQWDGGKKTAAGMAAWVLLSGIVMLAANLLETELSLWEAVWQTGIFTFGVFGLYPRVSVFRMVCALFGGYFIAENFVALPQLNKSLILPIVLLLVGVTLLQSALKKPNRNKFWIVKKGPDGDVTSNVGEKGTFFHQGEKDFDCSCSFGEKHYSVNMEEMNAGKACVNFGEMEVNLSGVKSFGENCTLDASCSFGELNILVPRTCVVKPNTSTAFASMDIKGCPDSDAADTIEINANVNFGEIVIRYI